MKYNHDYRGEKKNKGTQQNYSALCILLNYSVTLKFYFAKMRFKLRAKSNENKKGKRS